MSDRMWRSTDFYSLPNIMFVASFMEDLVDWMWRKCK